LNKDALVARQIQLTGSIKSHAILGGLHHHYVRRQISVRTNASGCQKSEPDGSEWQRS
jgi:hypothetical protein